MIMEQVVMLNKNWNVLQDVHDTGEKLGLYKEKVAFTDTMSQMSEWEELGELKHLQLIFAQNPYFGRELRYFNQAPWWYKKEFKVSGEHIKKAYLKFSNVDYYCKVWLNGEYLGEHEGYSTPFTFEVRDKLKFYETNVLTVKVSSPWDDEVECEDEKNRTILVRRRMVKGTYEHSDTFIQRDVNPVGIYGTVVLRLTDGACIVEEPQITYGLNLDKKEALVKSKVTVENLVSGRKYNLKLYIKDKDNGMICGEETLQFTADKEKMDLEQTVKAENINLWSTWDHGGAWMYQMEILLEAEEEILTRKEVSIAFRSVELERTDGKTLFYLNQKPFFIRGTSYFPDNYISAMSKDRYWRDLLNIKAAGFNLVRVHVHMEQSVFYQLCDELGIAVIQDSEYNWTHPSTDAWAEKFIKIFEDNIRLLMHHPSIICWIGMNEPGCVDPDGRTRQRFMEENPGPRMYEEIRAMDPDRPMIKGSFCETDKFSGDSHNYLGSLSGGEYGDIYGTTEKFNTEYGFDAPAGMESLKKNQKVYERLKGLETDIPKIQDYQYKLLKYYTEHYRIQKYHPCSGYVQFMFIDLCPQSFYGIYDWWGIPKKGLQAILESNMPLGIFMKYKEQLDGIYVVNDSEESFGTCMVQWVITDGGTGEIIRKGKKQIECRADSVSEAENLDIKNPGKKNWNVSLKLIDKNGVCIARNFYQNIFHLSPRVAGHPERMSHELGMRLYWA